MKYLRFIIRAPSFEDEDKSRAAALLHFILIATSIANIAAILARPLLLAGETLGPVSANIFILLVQIGLFALMWKGRVRPAGLILTAFMWLILAFGAYYNSGILNPVYGAQTVVIVMAGLLISEWAALFFALLSSAFGLWLVQMAEAGKYIKAVGTITTQITWTNEATAFVLAGVLLFLSLRTIREARKRAAEQTRSRRHSDERYRSLVENAPDTIFMLDRDHRITYLSRSTFAPVETLIGKPVYDFLHPDSRDAYRAAVNRVFKLGSSEQIEVRNLGADEDSAWYSVRFAPVWQDKQVVEVTAISTDITKQKHVQAALRGSEERYHRALDSLLEGAQIIGFDWRYLYVNDVVASQGRQPKEVLLRRKMTNIFPGIENTEMFAVLRTSMEQRIPQQMQNEFVYPDGTKAWFELRIQPIPEGIFILSLDVTERKKAEEALRTSEEQYRQLFAANPQPMFVIDLETLRVLAVNDAAVSHYGYSQEEFLTMTAADLREEEESAVKWQVAEVRQQQANYQRGAVIHHRKKDGSVIWVEIAFHQLNYNGRDAIVSAAHDLTERLKAEQAVRESEARLKARIDSAMDAIITIDEQQRITQFNPAAEKMFRVSVAEIIGQPISKLIPERFRAAHDNHIRTFGQTGMTNRRMGALGAISGLRANGEEFPIEASISQFDAGTGKFYSVILRDVTERQRAEDAIRRSEELFSTIFQSVPVAITIVSLTTGHVISVNDYLLKLVGYGYTEIVGRPVLEAPFWTNPDDLQALFQPFIEEGQPMTGVETQWRTQSDQILVMLGSAVQIEIHSEPCMLGLALDITERKQAERIRLEVYKERELLKVREHFISRMSHDFRTPLAVVLTSNELLRRYYDRMTPERREENFQNIENQVHFATQLLDDALTLSKEHAGKMPFNPVPINLVSTCEGLFLQMQTTDSGHHEFIFVTDGEIGLIEGDEKLLQHILINLLSNAIKYSPEGSEIRFEVRREGNSALISISDQGIGIPEEDQQHLFEPFYRASNTASINGTGLGLAIVKESVETHQGTIHYESAPGQGTTFVIHLPIAPQV